MVLNRYAADAAAGFVAGRNELWGEGFVEFEWVPNPERDITGYRVYRMASPLGMPSDHRRRGLLHLDRGGEPTDVLSPPGSPSGLPAITTSARSRRRARRPARSRARTRRSARRRRRRRQRHRPTRR